MKKVSQVIVSLVLLMSMMAISCKKNQNAPDPLPDKLVGLTGGVGAIQYDDQNRRTYLLGLTTGYYSTTYKYDSEGKVSDIQLFDGYGGGINHWYDYKINYTGGIPISGTRAYHEEYNWKSPATTYSVDSILYKTENGLVTEITYLDRKSYDVITKKPTGYVVPGIIKKFTLSYASGNLTRVHSDYETYTFTYGTKKGVGSANRMKFVLAECENPMLYSPNDMLTWQNQIHDVWTSNINSVYTYQYNSSGYPVSAAVKTTLNTGQVIDGNLSYNYQ